MLGNQDMLKRNLIKMHKIAISIVSRIKNAGFEAYFAGGHVRDMLLSKNNEEKKSDSDIDIATSASPKQIIDLFENTHQIGKHFGVILVVEEGIPFDVTTFRTDGTYQDGRHPSKITFATAQEDAFRRDFTINGMFYDPINNTLLDYVDGQNDLKKNIICAIGDADQRFTEDYLRMLRAIRFAARLNFSIKPQTWEALCKNAAYIIRISQERIYKELTLMLTGAQPDLAIRLLHQSGILFWILPEIEALVGVEQPQEFHPEGDVFTHTLLVLSKIGHAPNPILAWAALLHDVGKPATMTHTDRIRFNNHHSVGANISRKILLRLKAPNAIIEPVICCIENHMSFISVQQMRVSTLKRFLARETFEIELCLHEADCNASHGSIDNVVFLQQKQQEFAAENTLPTAFVSGKDLIEMGVRPGPIISHLLREVYDLQLEQQIINRENALKWLHNKVAEIPNRAK